MSKTKPNEVTQQELIDIATTMAQELQEFIDAAQEAEPDDSNPLPGTKALLDEWEAIFKRTDCYWQKSILTSHEEPDADWWPM